MLCFVVVMQSFIMNSHEAFIHIHQGCFAGTGAIVRLPQCQWSKPDGYGKISQCVTTTKHSKAKTVCIFLGIYCMLWWATDQVCILSFWSRKRNIQRELGQYHGCWYPGCLSRQSISNHGIDYVGLTGPYLPQGRISTTPSFSVLRNDRKCKYIL